MDDKGLFKFQFESAQARLERVITKLWIVCILLVMLLVVTNGLWVYYESQFEIEKTVVTQDINTGRGNAAIYDGVHIDKTDSCKIP